MIHVKRGDVITVKSGFIVHGCNDVGVMGSGIAATIKRKFPGAYDAYREHISSFKRKLDFPLGKVSLYEVQEGLWIVNAVTQGLDNPPRNVNYEAVCRCFEEVARLAEELGVTEVSFPAIGAGLGGGKWPIIEAIINNTLPDSLTKTLYVYP